MAEAQAVGGASENAARHAALIGTTASIAKPQNYANFQNRVYLPMMRDPGLAAGD
ncbi:hypothetical protein [Anianabacter salinae]|uniref:hypothetical protein n=1 Tax=Anianabacter salinae TaxID=2851023 RepID=UPI00225E5F90|nr:hypothetical protein [Anianabacter salinae]